MIWERGFFICFLFIVEMIFHYVVTLLLLVCAVLIFRKFTFYFNGYFCYNFILYPPFSIGSLPGSVLKLVCFIFLSLPFPLNGMILVNNILQLSFAQSNAVIHHLIDHLLTFICYGWEAVSKFTLDLPLRKPSAFRSYHIHCILSLLLNSHACFLSHSFLDKYMHSSLKINLLWFPNLSLGWLKFGPFSRVWWKRWVHGTNFPCVYVQQGYL